MISKCLRLLIDFHDNMAILKGLTLDLNGIIYIIIGAIIASLGLIYNSYPIILGGMLISPILNSIIRYCLGYSYNYGLFIQQGVTSLMTQMFFGIFTGYVIGLINIKSGQQFEIPTQEMENRTSTKYYYTDFVISLLCGFIYAYSMVNGQIAPIIGLSLAVAILPPLVNTGLYISLAHNKPTYEEYKEDIKKAVRTFTLAMLNIVGITFTCIIGLHLFCK